MIAKETDGVSASGCHGGRLVDAHFRAGTTLASERRMRGHLLACADCRKRYDRHLHLAAVDPGAVLPARTRLAHGLGLQLPSTRPWTGVGWLRAATAVAAISLCAIIGLGLFLRQHTSVPQARGGAVTRTSQLLVYEIAKSDTIGTGRIRNVGVRQALLEIDRGSGLAFAYVNSAHKHRLLVFAVDDNRHVYWYHPAWTDARDNPVGVAIVPDDAVHEISQAVTHRLAGQRLQLFGAFSDETLSVRDVEAAVARAPSDEQGLLRVALPGSEITRLAFALSGAP